MPFATSDYTKCSSEDCVVTSANAVFYNTTENTVYQTTNSGANWSKCYYIYIGTLSKTSAGKFTYLKTKTQSMDILTSSDKQMIVSWGMPDYSSRYSIASGFVAPCDGWINMHVGTTGRATTTVSVSGIATIGMYTDDSHNVYDFFPIYKGATFTLASGTLDWAVFYPCKGE